MGIFEEEFVSALIGLLVGTLFGNELSRYLYKPRVKVRLNDVSPLKTKDGEFFSIGFINVGRSEATNCSGYISLKDITSDKIMDPSKASLDESLPSYSYENLDISHPRSQMITPNKFRHVKHEAICWAHQGNPDQININPGSVQALDICKVQRYKDNKWYLIFPTERGWRNVRLRMEFKTDVYGRLFLCPSNEFPTITDFKIIMQDGVPTLKIIKPNFFQRIKLRITRRRVLMSD